MFRRLRSIRAALFTRRGALFLACTTIVLCLGAPQVWGWYQLRAARKALERYHPEEARAHLESCSRVWGDRPAVRLLACRAAWQDGDPEAATVELRAAQRALGGATEDTAFEWALVQASAGYVREVEEYLQKRAAQSPEVAGPLVWEALALGYLRVYRTLDSMAVLNLWLKHDPNCPRALELRGQTYVTGRGVVRGTEDFRRALELDPTRRSTRQQLAQALVALGSYDKAAEHLEVLAREDHNDPKTIALLARCYFFNDRQDEARKLLDNALARDPENGLCLRTRGQFAIMDKRPAEAEQLLRRATATMAEDYHTQWLLFEALRHQGKDAEAQEQKKRMEAVKERAARLGDLQSRTLAEFPLDPAVHTEMGVLLVRTGRGDVGERWLLTALDLDPEYRPAHAALAAYYESRGDAQKAAFHRAHLRDK